MSMKFAEPGGDSDFAVTTTNGFWGFSGSSNAAVATDFVHGGHVKSIKYQLGGYGSWVATPVATISDTGGRVSVYVYFNALPNATTRFMGLAQSNDSTTIINVALTTGGVLRLLNGPSTQIGTDGPTLSTGQWYRISLAWTITSTSVNRAELFVDGVSAISVTNATLTNVTSSIIMFGNNAGNATMDMRSSDHYVDDSTALTDPGNIWVTAKRPNANGTTNGFTTQIGSGGSGYGSGHSPQVNERALSITNGWSMIGAGSAVTEEYNIEGKATGDIDISATTIVDWLGWVSIKSLVGETVQVILDGANVAQAITSTITMYKKIKGSSTYPLGTGADIGVTTDTSLTTVSLIECGVIVAYIPVAATPAPSITSDIVFFN